MVESVAQGLKDGGIMKRRCVPRGGAAPGSLQRTVAGRTKGLDAFERRMMGMDVMEADVRNALGGREGSWLGPWCRALRRGRPGTHRLLMLLPSIVISGRISPSSAPCTTATRSSGDS